MSIRTKLIFWFSLAAIVPATVIALFTANSVSNGFITKAREELDQAASRGLDQLEQIRDDVRSTVGILANGPAIRNYLERDAAASYRIVDATLAQRTIETSNGKLDFFKILDEDGVVITSLEWMVFAGKLDLEWEEISSREESGFLTGSVRTDSEPKLGIRYVTRVGRFFIVGGVQLGPRDVSRFGAAKDIEVYLYDAVADEVVSNETEPAFSDKGDLRRATLIEDVRELRLAGHRYLVKSIPLTLSGNEAGSIVFLLSTAPLREEISNLWTSFVVVAILGVLLATLLGVIVSATVSNPLRKLLYAFELVSLGDFSSPLTTRRRDELGDILRSFNNTTDDLNRLQDQLIRSERVAAWQEIARKIAHEIKNPLSPIQISIETLKKVYDRKHPDFEKIFNESAKTIVEEVEKIRSIVQEFSDFARMPEPHFEEVQIQKVVRHVVSLYLHLEDDVDWQVDISGDLPSVWADEKQLQRSIINLVKNSLEAMPEGGTLSISVKYRRAMATKRSGPKRPGKIVIRIEDTGCGMTAENRTRVFTPYFTTKDSGSGLGLVIVQKIIELHKGRLTLVSEERKGTVAEITLPEKI